MPRSINPANGAVLATFDEADATAIESALARAAESQRAWRRQPPTERARLLARVAVVLRRHQDEWARLISLEMGKPLAEARGEIEKSAVTCDFYAAHAPAMLADQVVASNATDSRIVIDPPEDLFAPPGPKPADDPG